MPIKKFELKKLAHWQHWTLRRSWRKLLANFSTGTDENVTDIKIDGATIFLNFWSRMPVFENCGIKEITDWLNCEMEEAGFQLLNEKEINAEVRYSPKEDDEENDDESRMTPK